MKALLILSVFFICGCTQKAILNTQLPPEPKEIAETDSAGNFISAEYCFHRKFDNDSVWEWDFSPYKITNPLNFKLPEMCKEDYSYFYSVTTADSEDSLSLGRLTGGGGAVMWVHTDGPREKIRNTYRSAVEKTFNVYPIKINYEEVGIPLLQKEDTAKIRDLAGKSFPVKWSFSFRCKGEKVLDLQGIYYIRIYGVCTEKQLKIIEYGEGNE